MTGQKSVLVIGEDPALVDFSNPAIPPGLDAGKVMAALTTDVERLRALGYDAQLCLTDEGETAAAVVGGLLSQHDFDCVVIGAGVRVVPANFLLFEKLVNVVHEHAPRARLAFNTKPDDTAEAVQRWL